MPREENPHHTYKTHGRRGYLEQCFHRATKTQGRSRLENQQAALALLLALKGSHGQIKKNQLVILRKLELRYPSLPWDEVIPPPEIPCLNLNLRNLKLPKLCCVRQEEFPLSTPVLTGLFSQQGRVLKEFSSQITNYHPEILQVCFFAKDGSFHPYSLSDYRKNALDFESLVSAYCLPTERWAYDAYLQRPVIPIAQTRHNQSVATSIELQLNDIVSRSIFNRSQEKPLEVLRGQLAITWDGPRIRQDRFENLFKETFSC